MCYVIDYARHDDVVYGIFGKDSARADGLSYHSFSGGVSGLGCDVVYRVF